MNVKIVVPKTYSEWAEILTLLEQKVDDEAVLNAMHRGTIEWQTGVADPFSQNVIDVINIRMNWATDKLSKDMSRAKGQESVIVQALLSLRREMCFLAKAINLPAIPTDYRQQYHQLVIKQANSMQSSLEDSAKQDKTGKLASIVRNHRVNMI